MQGATELYDTIESLLLKIKGCLARYRIYLKPSLPLNPALKNILVETLVQVFTVLAIVTKYCARATSSSSIPEGKTGMRAFLRRLSALRTHLIAIVAHCAQKDDYFCGILGHNDVKKAVQKLEELASEEQLMVAADTNTVVRKGKPQYYICPRERMTESS